MEPATEHASEALDLSLITAEGLYGIVPDVGLFVAEDIIAWRDTHGAFPDEKTLVGELGLGADIAAEVVRLVGGAGERASGVMPQGTVVDAKADANAPADANADAAESAQALRPSPVLPLPPRGWRKHIAAAVIVVVAANAGLGFAIFQTRREGRRAVAPVGAIASDLEAVKGGQAESRSALDATRSELEETRRELAKQASLLQATAASTNEIAARQTAADRELKLLANREAADFATLAARLRDRRNSDGIVGVNLGEAVQLIDAAQGKPPAPKSDSPPPPRTADHDKPGAAPLIDW